MTSRRLRGRAPLAAVALLWASAALAADPPATAPEPSKEARQQMAAVHQKMADCLKSDRPMAECRSEMMSSCRTMMGEKGCPMMEHAGGGMGPGMMGPGMHRRGMMPGAPSKEEPKQEPPKEQPAN
jgi:hypothetical protein